MAVKKLTKKAYEEYLNEFGKDQPQYNLDDRVIRNFGSRLRRVDPIAFNVGYYEWLAEKVNKKERVY